MHRYGTNQDDSRHRRRMGQAEADDEERRAKSMNEILSRLVSRWANVPKSSFGVHKRMGLKSTQEEHEEITRDRHSELDAIPERSA